VSTEVEAPPESAVPAPPPPVAEVAAPRRRWRWPKLGIQSKLLLMLLATSIISCVVVGIVGYRTGRDALRDKAFEQLRLVRNSRAGAIEREYNRLTNNLVNFTQGRTAIEAIEALHEGFHELEDSTVTPQQEEEIARYYEEVFTPSLAAEYGSTPLPDVFLPSTPAQQYLQAWYTARTTTSTRRWRSTTQVTAAPGRPLTRRTTSSSVSWSHASTTRTFS
jgi:hypothetical protein